MIILSGLRVLGMFSVWGLRWVQGGGGAPVRSPLRGPKVCPLLRLSEMLLGNLV